MSGLEAARQLLEEAKREEFLDADLVARALRVSRKVLLRDWHRRRLPGHMHVGQEHRLASVVVIQTYFRHVAADAAGESNQIET